MPILNGQQIRTLCDIVRVRFTVDELSELTVTGLDVPLTDVTAPANPFPQVIFELVQWLERKERTREFLRAVREARSGVDDVVAFCDDVINASQTARQENREATAAAVRSVKALIELMREQLAQDAIDEYEDSFRSAVLHIDELGKFKKLHDNFQVAEGAFKVVVSELRRLRGPADGGPEHIGFDDDLAAAAEGLVFELGKVDAYAGLTGLAPNQLPWRDRVNRAAADLTGAVAAADGRRIDRVSVRLQNLIGSELPALNREIVRLARLLSLREVADDLQSVYAGLVGGYSFDDDSLRRLDQFEKGIAAVFQLDETLRTLLQNHDWLQGIDVTLGQLGGGRAPDVFAVADIWEDVRGQVDRLHPAAPPDWVGPLKELAGRVAAALVRPPTEPGPVRAAQADVKQFRTRMSEAFNRTDIDLLDLCGRLRQFGEALSGTLREMQHA
jgi:hypothetical protein